jgi:hypothetical protein
MAHLVRKQASSTMLRQLTHITTFTSDASAGKDAICPDLLVFLFSSRLLHAEPTGSFTPRFLDCDHGEPRAPPTTSAEVSHVPTRV